MSYRPIYHYTSGFSDLERTVLDLKDNEKLVYDTQNRKFAGKKISWLDRVAIFLQNIPLFNRFLPSLSEDAQAKARALYEITDKLGGTVSYRLEKYEPSFLRLHPTLTKHQARSLMKESYRLHWKGWAKERDGPSAEAHFRMKPEEFREFLKQRGY